MKRGKQFVPPQVSAGWFQRPYPYHLDYYRMRYGGSYAPYFGNLYGPPEVVLAPPAFGYGYGYEGNYGPYSGTFSYPGALGPAMGGNPAGFTETLPSGTVETTAPGE